MPIFHKAFTLIETLIAVAIVAIIAAITFPLIARAQWEAQDSTARNYLHQASLELLLYSESHDEQLPSLEAARRSVNLKIFSDPRDTWKSSNINLKNTPLVGSFAYVNGITEIIGSAPISLNSSQGKRFTLLVSVFSANHPPLPFEGPQCGLPQPECSDVTPLTVGYSDGSVRKLDIGAATTNGHGQTNRLIFGWGSVLLRSDWKAWGINVK